MNILLSICAWFFGITFAIAALSTFSDSVLASIAMFCGGTLLLPPIKKYLSNQYAAFTKIRVNIIGVILIILSAYLTPSPDLNDSYQKSQGTAEIPDNKLSSSDQEVLSNQYNSPINRYLKTNNYSHIDRDKAISYFMLAYLKLAAENFNDEVFLVAHNIEDAKSENAFNRQQALDNVYKYRTEILNESKNLNTQIAVDFFSLDGANFTKRPLKLEQVMGDSFSILDLIDSSGNIVQSSEITDIHTRTIFSIDSYDMNDKVFHYSTNTMNDNCSIRYLGLLNHEGIPDIIMKEVGVGLDRLNTSLGHECVFKVENESDARKIEDARVEGNLAIKGTAYYTLEVKPDEVDRFNSYQAKSIDTLYGRMDGYEAYIHLIEDDGSLSGPLAYAYALSEDIEK